MTVHAEQLPVAAVGRVVVVVAVLVVHRELAQPLAAELARAAAADPRQDLQRLLAVGLRAFLLRFLRLGDDAVELMRLGHSRRRFSRYEDLGIQSISSSGALVSALTFNSEKPRILPWASTFSITWSFAVSRKNPSRWSKITSR